MPTELFLVPMIGTGAGNDRWRGKYTRLLPPDDPSITGNSNVRYSRLDVSLSLIRASQTYLDFVASQPDATRIATADNIDDTLTVGQANAAKIIFEDAFIPAQLINAGDTRREVVRSLIGMFIFSQRLEHRFGAGWRARAQANGLTLGSIWSAFPQVINIRDSYGFTNTQLGVTNTSTMRQILKAISNQFKQTAFSIGRFTV
jgi:hypothetical protein